MSNLETNKSSVISPAMTGLLAKSGTAEIDAILQQSRVAPGPVEPSITPTSTFVVVPKPYTTPARVEIALSINSSFNRTGILTASGNTGAIDIFRSPAGGRRMQFNGQDNEFQGLELETGVRLFAQGVQASGSLGDYTLILELAPGPTQVGGPAIVSLTAVSLTLDICVPRTISGGDPPSLPQPIASRPPGSSTDKWFGGRLVNEQDTTLSQERAMLIVRQPQPAAFNGQLVLRGVEVSGTTIGALSNKAQLFANETPAAGQVALNNPHQFSGVPANGLRFFVQGVNPSAAVREMGFQLGIAGVEPDGDRVAVTVGVAPVIALASPAIVVKKPPVNPARKAVTLRTSSTFSGTGTLSRSGNAAAIKLFKADGTEITFTTDPVFTDLELSGSGVQLLAEGVAPSGTLGDYQLTLRLTGGGTVQTGNPITARMTAFDFRLDVAVSRTAPGVEPALLPQPPQAAPAPGTATDKVNLGRFVQVRDPGFSHERAMLIIQRSNPVGFTGTMVLTPINAQVQAFTAEAPADGQTPATMPFTVQANNIPANGTRLFVEGTSLSTAVRDTGFTLGVQGVEAEVDRVAMTTVQVDVIDTATTVAAATFVRFGLWDNAFRAPGSPPGLLFNEEAEADNFAGADSRRFHLRVRDVSARNTGRVQADWLTLDQSNNNLDAPATKDVTLVETPANSGIFISRGLLLVNDTDDQNQTTHSGLAAPLPDAGLQRAVGQRNHRTRKGSMLGSQRVEYRPNPLVVLPTRLPIFQRTPEVRRRLPLQIFVLRVGVGGAPIIGTGPTATIWTVDLRVIREAYERIGIKAETVIAPGTPAPIPANTVIAPGTPAPIAIVNGSDTIVLIDPPAGVLPGNVSFANETALGAANPAIANTIRVFFVLGLASGNGGETWTDAITTATDSRRGGVFTIQATGPYAAAHEVGHALTNKQSPTSVCDPAVAARSHFCTPTAPAGNRFQNDQNMMKRQFLGAESVTGAKRIWDANDADTINQFTAMLGSHYTRPF